MKKIFAQLLVLVMLLSLAACGAEPAEENAVADEPQSEQEVVVDNEAVVDETREPIVETEITPESEDAISDESAEEDSSEGEEEMPVEEAEPISPDASNNAPFGGLATYKGKLVRAYPAGYDVNSLWNAQVDELVYIGDVLYQGTARVWTVKDASTPPENYIPTDGSVDMRDFNGSPRRVFPEGYDTSMMLPVEPFETVYIGDVVYAWNGEIWGVKDTSVPPNQYTVVDIELDENGNPILDSPSPFH